MKIIGGLDVYIQALRILKCCQDTEFLPPVIFKLQKKIDGIGISFFLPIVKSCPYLYSQP